MVNQSPLAADLNALLIMSQDMNKRVFLKSRPGVNGEPTEDNFGVDECPFPNPDTLKQGEVIVKSIYLSVDPAFRCALNEETGVDYLRPCQIGETIHWLGMGIVTYSNDTTLQAGDYVMANFTFPWTNMFSAQAADLRKLLKELVQVRPSLALSALGVTGLSAYLGIKEKGHVTPGANQTIVVSAAAGSTGSLAGQIARHEGCRCVVGICGSDEKCTFLESELGFDSAINYKTQDIHQRLKETCPDGVDVYFDNVGGEISDKVIEQMTPNSHVVLCGQISVYNKDVPYPPPIPESTQNILKSKNITRERFLVLNYSDKFDASIVDLAAMVQQGHLKVKETVVVGIENAGKAFVSMMKGGNIGKQLVKVADV